MESNIMKAHPIKPVLDPLVLPYMATVLIMSDTPIGPISGSGVIIDQNTVLTVAHVAYHRLKQVEATSTYVFVQTADGVKKIKVKKTTFPTSTNKRTLMNIRDTTSLIWNWSLTQ